jgi:hypothetical protein
MKYKYTIPGLKETGKFSILSYSNESGELKMKYDYDKQKLIDAGVNLYRWVMETEEKLLIDLLIKNGGEEALVRLRDCINKAIEEKIAAQKSVEGDLQQHTTGQS